MKLNSFIYKYFSLLFLIYISTGRIRAECGDPGARCTCPHRIRPSYIVTPKNPIQLGFFRLLRKSQISLITLLMKLLSSVFSAPFLKTAYIENVVPLLIEKFNYTNLFQVTNNSRAPFSKFWIYVRWWNLQCGHWLRWGIIRKLISWWFWYF